jgi:predicted DNA-binding transcriptional regulator YafY
MRNAEVVRQWEILREIDGARTGITVQKLASGREVHQRTIRRDLEALSKAGFPLYDEKVNGTSMWKLRARPFRALDETGLGLTELCALYFSRTLLESAVGAPFGDDLERAFIKLERALPAGCRRFLEGLPVLLKAKTIGRKKQDARKTHDIVARALDGSIRERRVAMRYDSASSQRVKDYVVEPLRISHALGGIYLTAFVPEYGETRTFAVERIRTLALLDEHFERRPLPVEPFGDSLGAYTGRPEPIEIDFFAEAAAYIREREWHRSQTLDVREDGTLVLRMTVCNDPALVSWILSFGSQARVVAPSTLARHIFDTLEEARARYMPRLMVEPAHMEADSSPRQLPLERKAS